MPRARGGGRGAANAGIRAVANALGIARADVSSFTKIVTEAQPLYPVSKFGLFVPVSRSTLPIEHSDELLYMTELKQELLTRFHESSFYVEAKSKNGDIRRYTDKYRTLNRGKLQPVWSRLPEELHWGKQNKLNSTDKKRRKFDDSGTMKVEEKLAKLEEREGASRQDDETHGTAEKELSSDSEEENRDLDEQEALSDDDYLEEDNDYIHSYFDNGENYGELGSDDNLDDENAF
uniref:DNA-directed RNA polymerase III subunit n=1 Tax=Syphacia muris TaxID=451379 RepID=A0A0N5AU13_9BILA